MSEPYFSFENEPAPDRTPVRVIPARPMLLRTVDGTMAHCPAGEAVTVQRDTLRSVNPHDFEIVMD